MNELAVTTTPAPNVSVFSVSGDTFVTAQRMAKALSTSTMVPGPYRGDENLGNCLIALDIANRLGASPLMVMQHMVPIQGRPSWSATFLIATVNSCGRFTALRFRMTGTENTDDWGCRAYAIEKSTGETLTGTNITIKMSKSEGWYSRNGSKWPNMPEQMLQYRAASFWTRAFAPELSMGMQTTDEVIDVTQVEPSPEPSTDKPAGTRRRKQDVLPVETTVTEETEKPWTNEETAKVKAAQEVDEPPAATAPEPDPATTSDSPPADAPEPTMHQRLAYWLTKTGIPFEHVQAKMGDIDGYPDARTKPIAELSESEITTIQHAARSLERTWKARKA